MTKEVKQSLKNTILRTMKEEGDLIYTPRMLMDRNRTIKVRGHALLTECLDELVLSGEVLSGNVQGERGVYRGFQLNVEKMHKEMMESFAHDFEKLIRKHKIVIYPSRADELSYHDVTTAIKQELNKKPELVSSRKEKETIKVDTKPKKKKKDQ